LLRPENKAASVGGLFLADVAYWPILLQKSKIERPGKSRESRFLDAPAAARLTGANTRVGGRFGIERCGPSCRRARSASAVFKIFVLHPKKTFATISALSGHGAMSDLSPLFAPKRTSARSGNSERERQQPFDPPAIQTSNDEPQQGEARAGLAPPTAVDLRAGLTKR
jgi:hypothetical protein